MFSVRTPALRSLALVLLTVLAGGLVSAGATQIPAGPVSGVWSVAGSPYEVLGDIHVPSGAQLEVQAGAQVVFQGPYRLTVQGTLSALGDAGGPVTWNGIVRWRGLRFENPDLTSTLRRCEIRNAEQGVTSIDSPVDMEASLLAGHGVGVHVFGVGDPNPPAVRVDGCTVRDCQQHGIFIVENSNTLIRDCEITQCALDGSSRGAVQLSNQSVQGSNDPVISGNGRYVAFAGNADDLVAGDTNKAMDVFVRDLVAGTTVLVSLNVTGTGPGNNDSYGPILSADARFVAFRSKAGNLTSASFSGENLCVRDLRAGTNYLLTANNSPNGILGAAMTPDGGFIVSSSSGSSASWRVWDSLLTRGVFTNVVTELANGLAISPDGNRLAFATPMQLYAVDRAANSNWLVSPLGLNSRAAPCFSADGRWLAYGKRVGLSNQVYLHNLQSRTEVLVSHAWNSSAAAAGVSDSQVISADGRFVVYRSTATNLVTGDTNGFPNIFLYDRQTGANTLLSASRFGNVAADNRSLAPVFSGDGQVLLLAYMNAEAVARTLETGLAHYYSRSRGRLWQKGEESGHVQRVRAILYDCDEDTLLLKVDQEVAACHTGHRSCFYRALPGAAAGGVEDAERRFDPAVVYAGLGILLEIYGVILDRKSRRPEGSYVASLFAKGTDQILKKVAEESAEVLLAAKAGDREQLVYEMADLWFHSLVALADKDIRPEEVVRELAHRFGKQKSAGV